MKALFAAIWSALVLFVLFSNSITATLTDEEIDTLFSVLILLYDNEEAKHFGKKFSELRDLKFVISREKAGTKYDSFRDTNQAVDRSTVLEFWPKREGYMDDFREIFPGPQDHKHTADEVVARLKAFDVKTVKDFAGVVFIKMGCQNKKVHINNYVAFLNTIRSGVDISKDDASEIWKKISLNIDGDFCCWDNFRHACNSIEDLAKICRADKTIDVQPLVN